MYGIAWDLREVGIAQGEGMKGGGAPRAKKEISSQHPAKVISSQLSPMEISNQPPTKEIGVNTQ
jgi:hypothetical protein